MLPKRNFRFTKYDRIFFFDVSRDLILQLGEGIGLLEICSRFSTLRQLTFGANRTGFPKNLVDLKVFGTSLQKVIVHKQR